MATSDPLLPTPTANEDMHERMKKKENTGSNRHSLFLIDAISSPAASHANHSLKPDEGKERATTAISGRKCLGLFGNFGRDGSSVKMLRDCLLSKPVWFSNQCALTWKEQVTPSKRLLYRLSPSARRTGEIGFGLLLTPTVVNAIERSDEALMKKSKKRLASGRITTPPGNLQEQMNAFQKTGSLTDMTSLLPTPNASEAIKGRESSPSQMKRHTPGVGATVGNATGLKLHPNFVEWMMGYPQNWTDLNSPRRDIESNG